jgi:D-3-phosphoglycerate dehydrogenase
MRVIFSEVADVARGNAKRCSFEEVLRQADIVSLHVDGKPGNRNLFGDEELRLTKQGACFQNLSRGFVIAHDALARPLEGRKNSGAAVDVFPNEPEARDPLPAHCRACTT